MNRPCYDKDNDNDDDNYDSDHDHDDNDNDKENDYKDYTRQHTIIQWHHGDTVSIQRKSSQI